MIVPRLFLVLALAIPLGACSTHFDTSKQEGVEGRTIYRLTQNQAFAIAYNSIVAVLPGRKITEINGPVRGYQTYLRFVLDTYTQVVMVIPAKGTTSSGEVIDGFYFEISGRGSLFIQGKIKNTELRDTIQAELDELNVAVVVARVEGRPYETEEKIKPAEPTGQAAPASPTPPGEKTAEERLKKLKELYDQGVITEDEYNSQRAKIIESL